MTKQSDDSSIEHSLATVEVEPPNKNESAGFQTIPPFDPQGSTNQHQLLFPTVSLGASTQNTGSKSGVDDVYEIIDLVEAEQTSANSYKSKPVSPPKPIVKNETNDSVTKSRKEPTSTLKSQLERNKIESGSDDNQSKDNKCCSNFQTKQSDIKKISNSKRRKHCWCSTL